MAELGLGLNVALLQPKLACYQPKKHYRFLGYLTMLVHAKLLERASGLYLITDTA
jgi:hypothetical protein